MPTGTIGIIWAHGEDDFCIAQVKHILALEQACDAGVAAIFGRLIDGTWKLNDVRETIRLGLMGGGKSPEMALAIVKLHVDMNPLAQSVILAREVLRAALVSVPGEEVGKKAAAEATDPASTAMTAASAAPESTGSEPVSDTPRDKPTTAPSGSSSHVSTGSMPPTAPTPTPRP
jgi:hypothetical protein